MKAIMFRERNIPVLVEVEASVVVSSVVSAVSVAPASAAVVLAVASSMTVVRATNGMCVRRKNRTGGSRSRVIGACVVSGVCIVSCSSICCSSTRSGVVCECWISFMLVTDTRPYQ